MNQRTDMGFIRSIKNIANSLYAPIQDKLKLYYRPKQYIRKFGKPKGLALYHKFYTDTKANRVVDFNVEGYSAKLYLRQETSDVPTFQQIFLNTRYEMELPYVPKTIIDGGANVGFASVFFANKYPNAEVLAVEPDSSNFELVQKNTKEFSNIKALKSAIWGKTSHLRIKNPDFEKWAFEVEETDESAEGAFQAYSISDLITQMGWESVDFLKLDIEGSEMNVFTSDYESWLPKVKLLIVELHEKMQPGCTQVFEQAVSRYSFTKTVSGENLIYINEDLK
ncbi:FkbM family methyltransferase [Roseivirga sp. E12]|uniref:FkbM family methyltransferase n=1 Tax=Roseivirga sp. E12 TaxID=2819237 RepID=UPI001ABC9744|nr:FkbM family methyltransferase [Roseivirga sp. E12]MBO3698541.1 FkbM family methyltransferase [Roseivirga sp. E12]